MCLLAWVKSSSEFYCLFQTTLNALCSYYDFIIDNIVIDNIAYRDVVDSLLYLVVLAFPTERWELQLVARKFERRGLISYKEFVAALKAVSFLFNNFFIVQMCISLQSTGTLNTCRRVTKLYFADIRSFSSYGRITLTFVICTFALSFQYILTLLIRL